MSIPRDQLDAMFADLLDDQLNADDQAALVDTLRADPDARRRYVEFTATQSMLARALRRQPVALNLPTVAPPRTSPMMSAANRRGPGKFRVSSFGFRVSTFAAAAIITLAITAWFILPLPSNPQSEIRNPQSPSVALLTQLDNAVFAQSARPTTLGSELGPQTLSLESGSAQVMFHSNAMVDLVGPCEFELTGPNRGRLIRGTIACYVPPQARGFTIETDDAARIVDLGTQFTVERPGDGWTQVLVSEGTIRIERDPADANPDHDPTMLTAGQAARYRGDTLEPIAWHIPRAIRSQPTPPIASSYRQLVLADGPLAYWRFDPTSDNPLASVAGSSFVAEPVGPVDPVALRGRPALRFDQNNKTSLHCEPLRQAMVTPSYTLELWARPDDNRRAAMISLGDAVLLSFTKQNGRDVIRYLHRPLGPARGGTDLYTPYTPGLWHHIVAVKDGPDMRLYVDGELAAEAVEPSTLDQPAPALAIGRLSTSSQRYYHGLLAELAIYKHALSPQQIKAHYQRAAGLPDTPTQHQMPESE